MRSSFCTALLLAAIYTPYVAATTVLAHFMVENSYAYNVAQWETDMTTAKQMGVDGFALNWIPPDCSATPLDWMPARINDAYTAAEARKFKLVFSFDMSYSECNIYWNQTYMASMITKYAGSSATLKWNNKIVVTTYGGDQVSEYGNTFFADLKSSLSYSHPISFTPALTSYSDAAQTSPTSEASKMVSAWPSVDGFLNWQAWPLDDSNTTVTVDTAFQGALKSAGRTGPYIMAISPWQFKDLNDGNSADSWVAYADTLFVQRLHDLATGEIKPDIIELLTWNDFGESHYLRPLPSTDESATDYVTWADGMENYVLGQNHNPWRIIAKYYLTWWKTGKAPKITMDQVVYWYRIHPKSVSCSGGNSATIRNAAYPVDAVFAWALVKSKATVELSVGTNSRTFTADSSGPVTNMVPFPSVSSYGSLTPAVSIARSGKTVHSSKGSVAISSTCSWENYNPVVNLCGQGVNK